MRNKILIITPRFPYPVIGGDRLRIYEICKELSKKYQLTLLSLCESKEELNSSVPDDDVFSEIHKVYLPKWKSYLNCILALPAATPLQVAYYKSTRFKRKVDELSGRNDLVLGHLVRVANYIKDLPNKKILEMTDAISMSYERVSKNNSNAGIRGLIYKIEQKRLNEYERMVSGLFDCNVLVSQVDKEYLFKDIKHVADKALVCSNGVDINKFSCQFKVERDELVFIGNMYSAQNFDAAYWFAEKVMPLLLEKGDFKFKIIGRIKDDDKATLNSFSGVYATGSVDDVAIHAKGAFAGICSVRLAAGVQNKILEYMALGLPVISSFTGYEGLDAKIDRDILVANDPEEYVSYILRLKNDSNFARYISKNGNQYVKVNHSWSEKLSPLLKEVNQLLND